MKTSDILVLGALAYTLFAYNRGGTTPFSSIPANVPSTSYPSMTQRMQAKVESVGIDPSTWGAEGVINAAKAAGVTIGSDLRAVSEEQQEYMKANPVGLLGAVTNQEGALSLVSGANKFDSFLTNFQQYPNAFISEASEKIQGLLLKGSKMGGQTKVLIPWSDLPSNWREQLGL